MIAEDNSPKKRYLVFPCVRCGKYTYAKIDQLQRKCGVCHAAMQVKDMIGTEVAGVAAAAKLASQHNLAWIQQKGVTITRPTMKSPPPSSVKPLVDESQPTAEMGRLWAAVSREIRANPALVTMPLPFFEALIRRIGLGSVNYGEFLRFLKTQSGIRLTTSLISFSFI